MKENTNVLQYTISIISNGKINSFCLNDFGKETITFGRYEDNDIVLSSPIVSSHHGHFHLNGDCLTIFDDKSKNGTMINGITGYNGYTLSDGDYIKIDNPTSPLNQGILMIITTGKDNNKWVEFDLSLKDVNTIGRSKDCDISLDRVSIPLKHAKITNRKGSYFISCFDSKIGIILNNSILLGETELKEKDVILINDIRLIYSQNKLLYQFRESGTGVRLDAIDIVKTVKVKGKKRDISQHVNFSAAPGEFIAFVGGSGAGKSTFMKCISGVTKPTSGQVLINGNDLYNNYEVLKKLIGYVPQDNIIFDDLTLGDMLKYAANLRMPDDANKTEKEARIKDVLEVVELLDKQDVMIRNLSGGQQKRACIAVELIADPKLFFLDEPTSGLDPGTERSLMKTLRKMADSGKTIILVTHNTLNLHLCDKVVFFGYGGKLCFDGKPADALSFFGVNDFVDIYTMITHDVDKWRDTFAKSGYKIELDETKKEQNVPKGKKSKSFLKQFTTLVKRKFKTLFNNKQQLLMLFGQAPLIAILLSAVVTENLFYSYEETKSILFALSTAAIWVGLLNSIQEVCREKVILEKEVMSDLRISAYLASKVVYFLVLSFVQSFLLVGAFTAMTDVPKMGLMYNWFIESTFVVFLTIFSASSMGLVASCIAKDSSVALTMPTIILVPQLIFSGILFPLEGLTEKISNLILSKWSVESLGTINDLNSLVSSIQEVLPGYVREAENCYTFTLEHLGYELSVIAIMTVILIMISYFILKRRLESDK